MRYLFLSLIYISGISLYADTIQITGQIRNGTNGMPAKVERLELIDLAQGMNVKQVLVDAGPRFQFKEVNLDPNRPAMIRAIYRGQPYFTMIPPVAERRKALQTVTVFETGYDPDSIQVNSGLQLTRTIDGLLVARVYAIANDSNKTLPGDKVVFFIPENARDIKVTSRFQNSMPVDLTLKQEGRWFWPERGFRPGMTEMAVEFAVDEFSFEERPDRIGNLDSNNNSNFSRIVLWRPPDAIPEFSGAQNVQEMEVPDLGKAIQVTFTGPITVTMNNGSVWFENPLQSDSNPVFSTTTGTLIGVLIVLALLFSLMVLFSGLNIRISRS